MKMTLSERIAYILDDLKIDQVKLADIAEVTKGAVNQWTKSKPDATMTAGPAYAIADKTDYEPRWLMLGDEPIKKPKEDMRKKSIDAVWYATDERGRTTIFRAAQSQQPYDPDSPESSNGST